MICGLAQQLKERFSLFSTPGHGTRAELWLPVANGTPIAPSCEQEVTTVKGKKHATLLFVDDDFLISLSTTALLEDLGHRW